MRVHLAGHRHGWPERNPGFLAERKRARQLLREHLRGAKKPWRTRHFHRLSRQSQGPGQGPSNPKFLRFCQLQRPQSGVRRPEKNYSAVSLDDAEYAKEEFREKWDKKYPAILKSWDANWSELVTFFEFPDAIRRLIYTTNAVEGFHRMLRKFTKTRTIFPTDDAAKKAVYLSVMEISKKWTMPLRDWGLIYGQLMLYFDERLQAAVF